MHGQECFPDMLILLSNLQVYFPQTHILGKFDHQVIA